MEKTEILNVELEFGFYSERKIFFLGNKSKKAKTNSDFFFSNFFSTNGQS